jgi:hypothetical protein
MGADGMKVALVFFTYSGDAELLREAVKAVPRLRARGHEVAVWVADDAASPLRPEDVPEGVRYLRTEFERGGNLNGAACVAGMADVYRCIMAAGEYRWLVKLDCDTWLNSLAWLEGVDDTRHSIVGTVHVRDYVSGACYALSRCAVEVLVAALRTPKWRGAAARGKCEDRVFFYMCRELCGGELGRPARGDEPHPLRLWHDWQGERVSVERLVDAAAVDFKRCRWESPVEAWAADRVEALARMREYASFLLTGKR